MNSYSLYQAANGITLQNTAQLSPHVDILGTLSMLQDQRISRTTILWTYEYNIKPKPSRCSASHIPNAWLYNADPHTRLFVQFVSPFLHTIQVL